MICPECKIECFCWWPDETGKYPLVCGCCYYERLGESSHTCSEYLNGINHNKEQGIINTYNDPFTEEGD